jgi:hypothetical protein
MITNQPIGTMSSVYDNNTTAFMRIFICMSKIKTSKSIVFDMIHALVLPDHHICDQYYYCKET